jgi:hypothetical protein
VFLFTVIEMMKYTQEQDFSLCNSYTGKSHNLSKSRFRCTCPVIQGPASSVVFELFKKVHSTGSFLNK